LNEIYPNDAPIRLWGYGYGSLYLKSFYSTNPNYFAENNAISNFPRELFDIVGMLDLGIIQLPIIVAICDWVYQKEESNDVNEEPSNETELNSFVNINKEEEDSINQTNSNNVVVSSLPTKWKKRLSNSTKTILWLAIILVPFVSWLWRLFNQNVLYITFPRPSYYPHVTSQENITCTHY